MEGKRPDYQKLYALLFGAISDALDILPYLPQNGQARAVLQSALLSAEECYISAADADETKEN